MTNRGFVRPEQFLARNRRTKKPFGGKIDYDIDGMLVGSWYRKGTGGYAGSDRRWDYWVGHLAFAYHNIDPALVIVSLGDVEGRPYQFAVRANGSDPAKIGRGEGLVKYELQYAPIQNSGQRIELPEHMRGVQGILLLQLIKNRQLKMEAFPGKTALEVVGFSSNAALYER